MPILDRIAFHKALRDIPTEVRDVCGAGDTVFAVLSVEIVTGKSLRDACRQAMGAAGRQVGTVGVVAVA